MAEKTDTSAMTSTQVAPTTSEEVVRDWLREIQLAQQREKDWRKVAATATALYEGAQNATNQYNILFANTDTLAPALYNSVPRPVVRARGKTPSPLAKHAAEFAQNLLSYLVEAEPEGRPDCDVLWQSAVLAGLLPGRAVTRFKYEATLVQAPTEKQEDVEGEGPQLEVPGTDASAAPTAPTEVVGDEELWGEDVPWQNFLHGYARRWANVPWIAFFHPMTKAEFEENFPEMLTQDLKPVADSSEDDNSENAGGTGSTSKSQDEGFLYYPVYEIWDKAARKIHYISPLVRDRYLKPSVDDPLTLEGFWPIPEPLTFVPKTSNLVPICLYTMYKEQADELNLITVRINKIIRALKIRGAYDANVDALKGILEADDSVMIGIEDAAALYAQSSSIEKAIFIVPIEGLITVLQGLYTQRMQIKQVIFEITGLADVMRGSTQASETLGAQELKNKWGALRLRRMQSRTQRYVRGCLRLMLELAVSKFQLPRLRDMAGSMLPAKADQDRVRAALQQAQSMGQEPDPGALAMLQVPALEDVVDALRSDLHRSYLVGIETNSTVDAEATEDKQDVTEAMTALGQGLAGVGPLVQQGLLPFDAAKAVMMAVSRKFKFGRELDEYLMRMQAPQGGAGAGKDGKGAASEPPEVTAAKVQSVLATEQAKQETIQMEQAAAAAAHAATMEELQFKRDLARAKFQHDMQKLAAAPPPQPASSSNSPRPRR